MFIEVIDALKGHAVIINTAYIETIDILPDRGVARIHMVGGQKMVWPKPEAFLTQLEVVNLANEPPETIK